MEVALVMLIIGLLAGIVLPLAGTMMDQQRRKETVNKLAAIDQALLAFVTTNKRLPCPAAGTIASGAANAGVAQPVGAGDCTAQNTGIVPWATLGLGEGDVTDSWGVRITYRVPTAATGFTRANALDASKCDPAATGAAARIAGGAVAADSCNAGCTSGTLATACTSPFNFVAGAPARGLIVNDEAGTRITDPTTGTGAAYILISHGAIGGGGYNSAGVLTGSASPAGTNEAFNQNNNPIRVTPNGYYHGSQLVENTNNTHFDDIVSHPTIMTVLTKTQLAPRVQP